MLCNGPGYYSCCRDVFWADSLLDATAAAARRFIGGPHGSPDPYIPKITRPRRNFLRLYPRCFGHPRVVSTSPGEFVVEHGGRRTALTVRWYGPADIFSPTAATRSPIVNIYLATMRDAAEDGNTNVRISKSSGLPIFTDACRAAWKSRGNPHLDYENPERAAVQMLTAGLI